MRRQQTYQRELLSLQSDIFLQPKLLPSHYTGLDFGCRHDTLMIPNPHHRFRQVHLARQSPRAPPVSNNGHWAQLSGLWLPPLFQRRTDCEYGESCLNRSHRPWNDAPPVLQSPIFFLCGILVPVANAKLRFGRGASSISSFTKTC